METLSSIGALRLIQWASPSSGGYLQFFENFLVIHYRDKHGQRIFIFNINTLQAEEIITKGYFDKKIKLNDNELFIGNSYDNGITKITIHPDHLEREELDAEYMNNRNIKFD